MNLTKLIQSQIEQLYAYGVNCNRMNNSDLELLRKFIDNSPYILWINDYQQMITTFINTTGKQFYGYTDEDIKRLGFELYNDMIHPDHFKDVHYTMTQFLENPNGISIQTFKAKVRDNSYKWTISAAKAINHTKVGEPNLILSIVFDIDDVIGKIFNATPQLPVNEQFVAKNLHLYNLLSDREVEVLKMIGKAFTSKEIGDKINISSATVETHRNHIRAKLKAKNSNELVKYAILFHPEII